MGSKSVVIASCYFPGDKDQIPPPAVKKLVEFTRTKRIQLIIGCDANAHHEIWGNSDYRISGERLLDFIVRNDLFVLNKGSIPTYVHSGLNREEVLDLKISLLDFEPGILDWHVSLEPSLYDHRYIDFEIESSKSLE